MTPIVVLCLVLALSSLGAMAANTRLLRGSGPLVFFLIYGTFSGYLTHAFDRHPLIHISKWVLLILVVVYYANRGGERLLNPRVMPVIRPLKIFVLIYSAQMFNPDWSSVEVGVLNGLIGHMQVTLPMIFLLIGWVVVREPGSLVRIIQGLVVLTTVMALYGFYQYYMGWDYVVGLGQSFASEVIREHTWIISADGVVSSASLRPMSFAQDAGSASKYYTLGIVLSVCLLAYPRLSAASRGFALCSIAVQFGALLLTLVRSSLISVLVSVGFMALAFRRLVFLGLGIAVCTLLLVFVDVDGGIVENRFSSLTQSETWISSRLNQFRAIFYVAERFPLGHGIGRMGAGANRFSTPADLEYLFPPESVVVCLLFEAGIPGTLAMVAAWWKILQLCKQALLNLSIPSTRALAIPVAALIVGLMFTFFAGPTLYVFPINVMFWFLVGALYKLKHLDAQTVREILSRRALASESAGL